jgi:Leucine-rich repeat (LRR) protein
VNIPDVNFKAALITLGVDTSGDSEISYVEAKALTSLDVTSQNIADLTGIEAFINLTILNCYSNELSNIDVSDLTGLLYLACGGNQLISLNLSNNNLLKSISIDGMPDLIDVCVWELPFPPAGITADTTGSPNLVYS